MRTLICLLLAAGCGHVEPLTPRTAAAPEVRAIDVGTSTNAYVVMGARPILVDTGWGASTEKLEKGLAEIGVKPADITLIVLTHGHGDHAGGAKRMHELAQAPVLAAEGDVAMMQAGHNTPLKPMGFLGKLLRGMSDKPFPAVTPDIVIKDEFNLAPYGVEGKVVPMRGHTPGSLVVLLKTGEALVGDMLRGGTIFTHSPTRHLYHDDCSAAEAHLTQLVVEGTRTLFVGHGGPVDAKRAAEELRGQDCPATP